MQHAHEFSLRRLITLIVLSSSKILFKFTLSLLIMGGFLTIPQACLADAILQDTGFETPLLIPSGLYTYQYNPTGSPWVFLGGSGITASNTYWGATAPEGNQVAFLQFGNGTTDINRLLFLSKF